MILLTIRSEVRAVKEKREEKHQHQSANKNLKRRYAVSGLLFGESEAEADSWRLVVATALSCFAPFSHSGMQSFGVTT